MGLQATRAAQATIATKRTLEEICQRSHNATTAVALSAVCGLRPSRHGTQLFKRQLKQLPCHGGALHVLVGPNLLGDLNSLLRVDDAVGIVLGPQIPLQPQDC